MDIRSTGKSFLRNVVLPSATWLTGWGIVAVIPATHNLLHPLWSHPGLTECLTLGVPATLIVSHILRQSMESNMRELHAALNDARDEFEANTKQQEVVIDNMRDHINELTQNNKQSRQQICEREERYMEAARILEHLAPMLESQTIEQIGQKINNIPTHIEHMFTRALPEKMSPILETIQQTQKNINQQITTCIAQQEEIQTSITRTENMQTSIHAKQNTWVESIKQNFKIANDTQTNIERILIRIANEVPENIRKLNQEYIEKYNESQEQFHAMLTDGIEQFAQASLHATNSVKTAHTKITEENNHILQRQEHCLKDFREIALNQEAVIRDNMRDIHNMSTTLRNISEQAVLVQSTLDQTQKSQKEQYNNLAAYIDTLNTIITDSEQAKIACEQTIQQIQNIHIEQYPALINDLVEQLQSSHQSIRHILANAKSESGNHIQHIITQQTRLEDQQNTAYNNIRAMDAQITKHADHTVEKMAEASIIAEKLQEGILHQLGSLNTSIDQSMNNAETHSQKIIDSISRILERSKGIEDIHQTLKHIEDNMPNPTPKNTQHQETVYNAPTITTTPQTTAIPVAPTPTQVAPKTYTPSNILQEISTLEQTTQKIIAWGKSEEERTRIEQGNIQQTDQFAQDINQLMALNIICKGFVRKTKNLLEEIHENHDIEIDIQDMNKIHILDSIANNINLILKA